VSQSRFPVPPILLPIFFVGFWLVITVLIAVLGGWSSLAALYAAPDGFEVDPDHRYRFRSMQLRRPSRPPANYGNSMTVGLTPQGLYLAPFVLLRFQHHPLLISWSAISDCNEGSFLWARWVDLTLQGGGTVIRLYGGIGEAAWGEWRSRTRR